MALTAAEEQYVKDQKATADLREQIDSVNTTAFDAMHVKEDEKRVIDDKRKTDVAALEAQIDAIEG